MSTPADEATSAVGQLVLRHADHPEWEGGWLLETHAEFDIGRKDIQDMLNILEPAVSTHHLRFRCVIYGEDGELDVPPLVYVRVLSSNAVLLKRFSSGGAERATTLSKTDSDVLLNEGDLLQLTSCLSIVFKAAHGAHTDADRLGAIRKAEIQCFANQYKVTGRTLGSGGQGSVFVAIRQCDQQQFACKVVPTLSNTVFRTTIPVSGDYGAHRQSTAESVERQAHSIERRAKLAREYTILKHLKHPNIIALEKVFCATYNTYIVEELITGGDLLSYVERNGALNEPQTAVIVRQILKAVDYLHTQQIAHRDIKPENVLMTSWRDGARIVLTDFGQARTIKDDKQTVAQAAVFRMQSIVGTNGYIAPEILQQKHHHPQKDKGYSKAVDIWAVGCVAATLFTGACILDEVEYIRAAAGDDQTKWDEIIDDRSQSWQNVGRKSKSFIRDCLTVNDTDRMTVKQALLHPWFTNRYYSAELEAAYERAIADWKPRVQCDNLIEIFDTTNIARLRKVKGMRLTDETRSRHFDQPAASPSPSLNPLNQYPMYSPPVSRKHSPLLPSVAEDAKTRSSQCSTANATAYQKQGPDDSVCVPNSPPPPTSQLRGDSLAQLSIYNYKPPETQFNPNANNMPRYWKNTLLQSQASLFPPLLERAVSSTANGPYKRNRDFADFTEDSVTDTTQQASEQARARQEAL